MNDQTLKHLSQLKPRIAWALLEAQVFQWLSEQFVLEPSDLSFDFKVASKKIYYEVKKTDQRLNLNQEADLKGLEDITLFILSPGNRVRRGSRFVHLAMTPHRNKKGDANIKKYYFSRSARSPTLV